MYPQQCEAFWRLAQHLAFPVPSHGGRRWRLRHEVAAESSYLLPTPSGNSLGQAKYIQCQKGM